MNILYRAEINNMMPYVPGKPIEDVKRELGLEEVIKIASNENPYGCSPKAKQAIIDAFEDLSYYPDGNATLLKEAVANFYGVNTNQLLFGCGSDEIVGMIAQVFLNPGEEILTSEKSFPRYDSAALLMGGHIVKAPMTAFTFDLENIAAAITDKTKIIILANPNNPTGTYFTHEALVAFLNKVPDNILVILDEAYIEFSDAKDMPNSLPLLKDYSNLMISRTFSKAYGLASLRVGYIIADEAIVELLNRVRNPFNVNSLAQVAAVSALKDQDFIKSAAKSNAEVKYFMYEALEKLGLPYLKTQSNFIMFEVPCAASIVFEKLQAKGFIVRPGFGMPNHVRATLGTMEQMKAFIPVLADVLKQL